MSRSALDDDEGGMVRTSGPLSSSCSTGNDASWLVSPVTSVRFTTCIVELPCPTCATAAIWCMDTGGYPANSLVWLITSRQMVGASP